MPLCPWELSFESASDCTKTFSALLPCSPIGADDDAAAVLSSPPIVMLLPMALLNSVPIATGSNCDHPKAPVPAKKKIAILTTNCLNTFGAEHSDAHHGASSLAHWAAVAQAVVAVVVQMATAVVAVLSLSFLLQSPMPFALPLLPVVPLAPM